MEKLLTVKEVAQRLNVSPRLVRSMLRQGSLPGLKLTRTWRVPEESLQVWLTEKVSAGTPLVAQRKSARGVAKHLPFSVEQFLREKEEQAAFEEQRLRDSVTGRTR